MPVRDSAEQMLVRCSLLLHALRLQAESLARGAGGSETDGARTEDAAGAPAAAEAACRVLR